MPDRLGNGGWSAGPRVLILPDGVCAGCGRAQVGTGMTVAGSKTRQHRPKPPTPAARRCALQRNCRQTPGPPRQASYHRTIVPSHHADILPVAETPSPPSAPVPVPGRQTFLALRQYTRRSPIEPYPHAGLSRGDVLPPYPPYPPYSYPNRRLRFCCRGCMTAHGRQLLTPPRYTAPNGKKTTVVDEQL